MSQIPADLKYTASHAWVSRGPDGTLAVGITDHAQAALGDVVFVELPEVGREVTAGESIALVESVKTASDIYAPVSGVVSAINPILADAPQQLNDTPYGTWLFKLQPLNADAFDALLDATAYGRAIGE